MNFMAEENSPGGFLGGCVSVAHKALGSIGFVWVQREAFVADFFLMCVVGAATGFGPGPGPS